MTAEFDNEAYRASVPYFPNSYAYYLADDGPAVMDWEMVTYCNEMERTNDPE